MYVIRVLFSGMALVILALNDTICHNNPGSHGWLLLAGIAYPHLGHLLLGRFDARRRRGHIIFMVDGLFVGMVIAALNLAVVPTSVLVAINLFNWMIVGGPTLIAFGIISMLAGVAAVGPSTTEILQGTVSGCASSDWLASGVLVCYFLIVARVIHQLVEELHHQQAELQAESDAAAIARNLSERALLAVLPPSVAQVLAEKGEVPAATIDHATLLCIEFNWGRRESPTVGDLTDAFNICDLILTRHGFEMVKTFGRRALAISRVDIGPDNAVVAAREINNYFADHRSLVSSAGVKRTARVVMHYGSVTQGLVQPERLNLELLGETVEGLEVLAAATQSLPPATVIASLAAHRELQDSTGFVLVPGDNHTPPCYLLQLDTAP